MNPSFMAFAKSYQESMINLALGITHTPKPKKDPNAGAAFAKGHGVQQDEPSDEKEHKTREYLDNLAAFHREKANILPEITVEELMDSYPRSDLIVLAEEEQARREKEAELETTVTDRIAEIEDAITRHKSTQKWVKEEMARNAALDL